MANDLYQGPEIPALTQAQVDIGRLETEVKYLTTAVDDLKRAMGNMEKQMQEVLAALNSAKGGWRVLMLIGGASAAFGGAISWAVQHVSFKGLP